MNLASRFARPQLRLKLNGLVALTVSMAILLTASACTTLDTTLRYRLTVIVETPQGLRSGSSVVEVNGYVPPRFPGSEAGGVRLHLQRGEATPVELANGNHLFAVFVWASPPTRLFTMLTASFADQLPSRSPDPEKTNESMMEQFRALKDVTGVRELRPEDYPIIATFTDKTDAHSILIAPATKLPAILPAHRIVRMTVEITDDPVSHKLFTILPLLQRCDWGFFNLDIEKHGAGHFPKVFPEYQKVTHETFVRGVHYIKDYKHNVPGSPVPCIVRKPAE